MYVNESNTLQLIALLKKHNIKKIVASPGNTNISFIGSIQDDPFFQIYSCVDERSAAYIACGLSEESNESVVLSCTGATAARNYPSGLTEAFYRKLPIVAITSSQAFGRVGQLFPQFTDRNVISNDVAKESVQIPYPYSEEEKWSNNIKINKVLLQLKGKDKGPVHINIETLFSSDFSVKTLPEERAIMKFYNNDKLPNIKAQKVCIFVGSHSKFTMELQNAIDEFCEKYNAIVLCDQTSNYKGKYRILGGLVAAQSDYDAVCKYADLYIHIGEISGSYYLFKKGIFWRVNEDGEIRDPFRLLESVFEMNELDFFNYYNSLVSRKKNTYFDEWKMENKKIESMIEELPLSNAWMCQQTAHRLPQNSVLHLAILNSLRSWNLFDTPNSVYSYSNVGGFGIDGCISSCVGASLVNKQKLYFCVSGDLATFYDLNVLGNRHIGNNFRLLVSNNGTGFEMHCKGSIGSEFDYAEADRFFCAGGHFGSQSRLLLRHFAEDLGFDYIKAETKEEYLNNIEYFVDPNLHEKPLIFEVFVNPKDDEFAYNATKRTITSNKAVAKKVAKKVLGNKGYNSIKKMIKG